MRELEGTGIVHRSDSDYNPQVVNAIKDARLAKDPRAFIDYLSGGKPWSYASKTEDYIDTKEKKEEEEIEDLER